MAQDPYVSNKVVLQLIQTPATSQKVLDAVSRGTVPRNPPAADNAIVRARGWLRLPFQDQFQAPEDLPMVAIPAENGFCDVIRAMHKAEGLEIETAQARKILSIRVKGYRGQAGGTELSRAEELAKRILALDDKIKFVQLGTLGPRTWGVQSDAQPVDAQWPHWFDKLHWWTTADDVGFVTLKAVGGPTREVLGPFEEMNTNWFGK